MTQSIDYSNQLSCLNADRSAQNPFLAAGSEFSDFKPICAFLAEMNKSCARLDLKATFFDSPHGMSNCVSRSTAHDMAKLSAICLQNPTFAEIVSTGKKLVPKQAPLRRRSYEWVNTHKMLGFKNV